MLIMLAAAAYRSAIYQNSTFFVVKGLSLLLSTAAIFVIP